LVFSLSFPSFLSVVRERTRARAGVVHKPCGTRARVREAQLWPFACLFSTTKRTTPIADFPLHYRPVVPLPSSLLAGQSVLVSADGAEASNDSDVSPGWVRASWGVCAGQVETFALQLSQGVSGKDRIFGVCSEQFADLDPDMTGMDKPMDPNAPFYRCAGRNVWFFQNKSACSDGVLAFPPEKFDFFKTGDLVTITVDRSGKQQQQQQQASAASGLSAASSSAASSSSSSSSQQQQQQLSSPGFSVLTLRVNGAVKASIGNLPAGGGPLFPAVFCYNSKQSFRIVDAVPGAATKPAAST
jgi:hypothetical protein